MNLEGKVAIVTGGASGIGLEVVKDFLAHNMKVVIADYSDNGAEILSQLNNPNVKYFKIDVSKENEVKALVAKTVELFGKLDVMVANAGVGDGELLHEVKREDWDRVIGINLSGVFYCNKYALEEMLKNKSGSIINVSSILGLVGEAIAPIYCSAKGGVNNLTRSGAIAYAKDGIRINAICPGYIKTPLLDNIPDDMLEMLKARHPIGRLGKVSEVAPLVRFLASDESTFITGTTIPVDGGYTAM